MLPLDFEMERSGRTMRRFLLGLICFVAAALVTLALVPMREVAVAAGEIRPNRDIVDVQHPEGGEVMAVLAHAGAMVRPGDPLVRLRPIGAETNLDRLAIRRAHFGLRRERLDALLAGRQPTFALDPRLSPDAAANERALFELQRQAFGRKRAALEARLTQRRAEVAAKRIETASAEAEIAAYREQMQMRETLMKRGFASRDDFLTLRARYAEARTRQAAAEGALRVAETAIVEIEAELAEAIASQRSEWSRERSEIDGQIGELDRQIAEQADRLDRLTVRSPTLGVVKEVQAKATGAVVQPGGPVATVVPLEGDVIAEVRVAPSDVGHIEVGDAAKVRVSTFDPEVVGEITGSVRSVSPAAFTDEQGGRYFKALLRLDRTAVTLSGEDQRLTPGMAVQAQISTGEKSVLRYLFKPVARALDKAFSER